MRLFRCVAVAVLPLLLIAAVAGAEEPFPYPPGDKQIVFGFSGWNPQAYQGGLGFRFFHSNRWATNLVVTGAVRSGGRSSSRVDYASTDDYERVALGLVLGAEKYLATLSGIAPYLGLGLGYTYSWSDDTGTISGDEEERVSTSSRRAHDVGLYGKMGAEWAFTQGMTLGVWYVVRFSREWSSEERVNYSGSQSKYDSHEWALGMGAGLLTVSIRF